MTEKELYRLRRLPVDARKARDDSRLSAQETGLKVNALHELVRLMETTTKTDEKLNSNFEALAGKEREA